MIDDIIREIVRREGGYVNHPDDPGGATNYGITEAVARENGYHGSMRDLPIERAVEIYRRKYADRPGFTPIADIDPAIAEEVIDSGVNAGPARSGLWLQQALNILNRQGRDYPDIPEDGQVGPKTLDALRGLVRKRGPARARSLMLKALNGLQFNHYFTIARNNTSLENFMPGWLEGRIGL